MQPFKYKPKINTGDLRHRISIYDNVRTQNELGETTYSFEKVDSIWAHIIPQTGKLQNQAAETILSEVTHKIVVRYHAGKNITKDMQIRFRNHRFEIDYILNPYFRDETLEIFVKELVD